MTTLTAANTAGPPDVPRVALGPDGLPMTGRKRVRMWRRVKPDYGPNAGRVVWIQTTPLPYEDERSFYDAKGFKLECPKNVENVNGELVEITPAPPESTVAKRKYHKRGNI